MDTNSDSVQWQGPVNLKVRDEIKSNKNWRGLNYSPTERIKDARFHNFLNFEHLEKSSCPYGYQREKRER